MIDSLIIGKDLVLNPMHLFRIPKSPYWYADLRKYGWGKLSTRLIDKKEAELAVYQFLAKKGIAVQDIKITLSELITRYLAYAQANHTPKGLQRDRQILKLLLSHLNDLDISNIKPDMIEGYKIARLQAVSASTVRRDLNVIRSMFNRTLEWGYLLISPVRFVKNPKLGSDRLPRFYTHEEIGMILQASDPQYRNIWLLFLYTGCRRGEILGLKWTDIKGGKIYIRKNKEKKEKIIPISKNLENVLAEIPRTSDHVLPSIHESSLTRTFKRTVRKAGLQGNLHWLRHSTATHLLMAGEPIQVVSQLLGHSNIRTTQIYSHALAEHLKKAVDKLDFV